MGLLDNSIRKHLSSILGAEVTFEKLSISLLGSIDAHGVAVAGVEGSDAGSNASHGAEPFLTIRRLHADIAIARAFKGEIVFKSLSIERPVISLLRRSDGTSNLPRMLRPEPHENGAERAGASAESGPGDHPGNGSAGNGAANAANQASGNARGGEAAEGSAPKWRLETPKIFVVDGEAHFRQQFPGGDYRVSATGIVVELTHNAPGFDFTVTASSLARRDKPVETGTLRATGRIEQINDLSNIEQAGLTLDADLAAEIGGIHITGKCPALSARGGSGTLEGAIDAAMLLTLLPAQAPAPPALRGMTGIVRMKAAASYSPERGAEISDLNISTAKITAPGL